jgi:hypothetical protein
VQGVGELRDAVVEVGKERPVDVVGGELVGHAVPVRRVQMGLAVAAHHNGHGPEQPGAPAVLSGRGGAGGIGHATRAEEDQAVDALGLELGLNLGLPVGPQADHVGFARNGHATDGRSRGPVFAHDLPLPAAAPAFHRTAGVMGIRLLGLM